MTSVEIAARGRAMRAFVDRIRARGDVAVVEETEDLPTLRLLYLAVLAAERGTSQRRKAVRA